MTQGDNLLTLERTRPMNPARRLAVALIGACLLPVVAAAQQPTPRLRSDILDRMPDRPRLDAPAPDPLRRDIRSFGALPGRANAVVTRQAIQAAIDTLPKRGTGERAVIVIPGDRTGYFADRPIHADRPDLEFIGDGPDRSFLVAAHAGSVVQVGMPRLAPPSADHWPDAFGLLDATAAPAPGRRFGLALKADSHAAFGPPSFGRGRVAADGTCDWWGKTSQATVEVAFDGPWPVGPIVGAGWGMSFDPIGLNVSDWGAGVGWTEGDGTLLGGTARSAGFQQPALPRLGPGVHRLAVQVDITGRGPEFSAWLDGVQVTNPSAPVGGSPRTFRASQGSPWRVGAAGGTIQGWAGDSRSSPTLLDATLLGLRVSAGLRYADDGKGSPQRRLDGRPIDDLSTYFARDAITVGLLAGDEPPADAAPSRRVAVSGPAGRSSGFLMDRGHLDPNIPTAGVTLRGLTVRAAPGGEAVTLGYCLRFRAERVRMDGGGRGLSSWNYAANYPHYLSDCVFEGTDAAIYLYGSTIVVERAEFPLVGRVAAWNVDGQLTARDWFFTHGEPVAVIVGTKGATNVVERLNANIEGGKSPTDTAFISESGGSKLNGPPNTGGLSIAGFIGGNFLKDRPVIRLVGGDARYPGWLSIRDQWILQSKHPCLVEASAGWSGSVDGRPPSFPLATGAGAATIRSAVPPVVTPGPIVVPVSPPLPGLVQP
jgi:hypothetical protein